MRHTSVVARIKLFIGSNILRLLVCLVERKQIVGVGGVPIGVKQAKGPDQRFTLVSIIFFLSRYTSCCW